MVAAARQASAESADDHWDNAASPADEEVGVGGDDSSEEQHLYFESCLALTDALSLVEETGVYGDS